MGKYAVSSGEQTACASMRSGSLTMSFLRVYPKMTYVYPNMTYVVRRARRSFKVENRKIVSEHATHRMGPRSYPGGLMEAIEQMINTSLAQRIVYNMRSTTAYRRRSSHHHRTDLSLLFFRTLSQISIAHAQFRLSVKSLKIVLSALAGESFW